MEPEHIDEFEEAYATYLSRMKYLPDFFEVDGTTYILKTEYWNTEYHISGSHDDFDETMARLEEDCRQHPERYEVVETCAPHAPTECPYCGEVSDQRGLMSHFFNLACPALL